MRVYVTGSNGHIGKALIQRGCLPLFCDVTSPMDVWQEIEREKPDIILHLAAKSDPDFCEPPENRKCVIDTNFRGANHVFLASEKFQIPCVFFSTGQIWRGGFWERAHRETDKFNNPVNYYGMSKMVAELAANGFQNVKTIRLSSVFDKTRLASKFDKWEREETIFEPTFIRRSYIYIQDFVDAVLLYTKVFFSMPKVLHLAGGEVASAYDLAYELAKKYGYSGLVKPRRWEIGGVAPRPRNGGLDVTLARSLGFRTPDFIEGIERMCHEG